MNNRLHKVNENLRNELSQLLIEDPISEQNILTINQVLVTPDLRQATVWVSALDPAKGPAAIELLNKRAPSFFLPLSDRLRMKHVPQLLFKLDEDSGSETRIDEILEGLQHQDKQ